MIRRVSCSEVPVMANCSIEFGIRYVLVVKRKDGLIHMLVDDAG